MSREETGVRLAPELLIDGCVQTLLESVLPSVEARFARGQLYAVADVLRNLRDRVELRADAARAEAESAAQALAKAADALRAGGAGDAAASLERALAAAPAEPIQHRADALRAALGDALVALDALGETAPPAAQRAIAAHLGAQALRDVSTLKPSLLNEISKG